MWTLEFWQRLAERVLGAASTAALSALGGDSLNVWEADVRLVLGLAAGAALISLLNGIAAKTTGNPADPTLRRPRREGMHHYE